MSMKEVRLLDICHARSGDKADKVNVGLIANSPEFYPVIAEQVTAERVKEHFAGIMFGKVDRYEMKNINAINFVLHSALGGGAARTLYVDNIGKCYGANLLRMKVQVDESLLKA